MAVKPVANMKQILDKQGPTASDHQESAKRAAHVLHILTMMRHRQEQSIQDEQRGILLDTYG